MGAQLSPQDAAAAYKLPGFESEPLSTWAPLFQQALKGLTQGPASAERNEQQKTKKAKLKCIFFLSPLSPLHPPRSYECSPLKAHGLPRSLWSRPSYSSHLPPVDSLMPQTLPLRQNFLQPRVRWVHPSSTMESQSKSHGRLFIPLFPGRNKHPNAERRSWASAERSLFMHQSFIYSLIIHPPRPHQSFICLLIHSVCTSRSHWWPQMSVWSCFDLSSSLWQLHHRNFPMYLVKYLAGRGSLPLSLESQSTKETMKSCPTHRTSKALSIARCKIEAGGRDKGM